MNYRLLIMGLWLVTVVVAGCGQSRPCDDREKAGVSGKPLDRGTFEAGLDPNDKRIVAFVSWLKRNGVTLEYSKNPAEVGWWRVAQPKPSEEYDVMFSIRTFPSWASEDQMRKAIDDFSLAYMFNGPAHLAMSYGGYSGTRPEAELPKSEDELPKIDGLPITKAVEKWFKEYKGR
jgi:hypothetical protein